ncbi:MAG: PIN domain-containing protein [Actinomycetota bacterium]|nr:PIN domain-containing protein [Actinomycetota bacterium]
MTIVLDTNVVVALYDAADPDHGAVAAMVETLDEDLVATPLAVAEMDYLVRRRGGPAARDALWRDLASGACTVRWWADALDETLAVAHRHPFLGLTDASLVALAARVRTQRIATLDAHFRSITTPDGQPFMMLPSVA